MEENFESKKNIKAGSYTALVCAALLIIFLFVHWSLPALPEPPADEGIEVNLGNSDQGMGEDQPMNQGSPAPASEPVTAPPAPSASTPDDNVRDIPTDDNDKEAPEIKKPIVTKPDATKIPEKEVVKNKPVKKAEKVVTPAPPAPKPKAKMGSVSGTGTGGNEADSYRKGSNQGVAGGSGDQGRPGGNPESDNYTGGGGTGKSGVSISRGLQGRKFTSLPSFQDDFNENAKVAIDIRVNESGQVVSATYQPRGSTTSDASMKAIAIRKAQQIKFNSGSDESVGTLIFNFRLRN